MKTSIRDQQSKQNLILATKLYIPPPRPNRVARPRLIERLNLFIRDPICHLTLISAPAGFGKTTLLSEWVKSKVSSKKYEVRDEQANTRGLSTPYSLLPTYPLPPKFGWLSLDAGDNDPLRFLRYITAALQTIAPQVGETIPALLQSPQSPPLESILTELINELCAVPDKWLLVLDDYHVIESDAIHAALTFLIEHQPPCLRLVIATRSDPALPLARWRSRGQLAEIRTDDLRFEPDEARLFLNQTMGLELSAQDIDTLEARTEGWIAGLQMAAISLQGRPDRSHFIQTFSGSHRYILSYLTEEILARQTPAVQTFLLCTSVLEQLSGGLCDAITAQSGGQTTLEKLEKDNLFLVPLDEEGHWYRYHHLFGDLLRRQLEQEQPARVPELHRRASLWFEAQGLVEPAIKHALAAGDQPRAARLVNDCVEDIFKQGEHATLLHRIAALPLAEQKAYPLLSLFQAIELSTAGKIGEAEQLLHEMDQTLPTLDSATAPERRLIGRAAVAHALVASFQDDPQIIVDYARQALEHLPPDDPGWRSSVLLAASHAYRIMGNLPAAAEALSEAITLGRSLNNHLLVLSTLPHLIEVYRIQGRLRQAFQACQAGLRYMDQHGLARSTFSDALWTMWGYVLCEKGEPGLGAEYIQRGLELSRSSHKVIDQVWAYQCLIRCSISQGDWPAAEEWLRQAETLIQNYELPFRTYPFVISLKIQILIQHNRLAEAEKVLQSYSVHLEGGISATYFPIHLGLARLLVAQEKLPAAGELLDRLLEFSQATGHGRRTLMVHMLRCRLYLAWRDTERAHSALQAALEIAEPEGFIQDFLDEGEPMKRLLHAAAHHRLRPAFARRLLAAFPPEAPERPEADEVIHRLAGKSKRPATSLACEEIFSSPIVAAQAGASPDEPVEALSPRELEVLRLVAAGLSNREIAEQLVLAVGTVKTHVHNIYGKLGARHRAQALARAKALNLL